MGKQRKTKVQDWGPFRGVERAVRPFAAGSRRLALAYANTYEVGMSSLGFQRVYELVHDRPDWSCERFFTDGTGPPRSVEADTPLGEMGCIAFSVSFEEDYPNLLRLLDRAGVPLRRRDRGRWDPLIVMGGSCAAINPLPMADFVDIFALGAAENLLPALLSALEEGEHRVAVTDRLSREPGFYVPACHRPEADEPLPKLRKLELTAEQMREPGHLPTTAILTPRTEFSDKLLVEMSRGCPEKCRYCWATFGMGKFRWHPTGAILDSFERARPLTDQLGFVATAVGDHPEIERLLGEAHRRGFRAAISSIRIPAVTAGVLAPLQASGARSITLAPETGSDRLRLLMNKPIPNETLLDKVRLIFRHGFTQLKLYFIVGLPEENDDDIVAILELAGACRGLMLEEARKTGTIGHLHLGVNVLVPKPYTPWQREPMDDPRSLRRKLAILKKGVARLPNVSMGTASVRQAVWQTYLSRASSDAGEAIESVARGRSIASVVRDFAERIHPEVYEPFPRQLRWHFLRMG